MPNVDVKITELPTGVTLSGTEWFEAVQAGNSVKISAQEFALPTYPYLTLGGVGLLTQSRQLLAGTGIEFTDTGAGGSLTVSMDSDITDASVLVLNANSVFTNERVLVAGSGILFTDSGPGGTLTVEATGLPTITSEFVLLSPDGALPASRTLTAGNGITLVDAGAGSTVTINSAVTSLANPSAAVGLTPVNGVATTAMRSDAAPPIDQAITPTWTGNHIFQTNVISHGVGAVADAGYWSILAQEDTGDSLLIFRTLADDLSPGSDWLTLFRDVGGVATDVSLIQFISSGDFTFNAGGQFDVSADAEIGLVTDGNIALTSNNGGNISLLTGGVGEISLVADGGVELHTQGVLLLQAIDSIDFEVNAVLRFAIEDNGSWELAGNAGTSGQVLTSAGASGPPTWQTAAGGVTGLANPTASVGLSAVNGAATTAMRSDAAPALNQGITPTWTGLHTFTVNSSNQIRLESNTPSITFYETDAAVDNKWWLLEANVESFFIGAVNDAGTVSTFPMLIDRTGTTIDAVRFPISPVLVQNGSAAAPAVAFVNETDTGLYLSGGDTLAFSAGGTLRFFIDTVLNANANGSASAPVYTWGADTDTGMYRITGNVIGFSTGGAFKVGIGSQGIGLVDGSAAGPAYTFDADTNTGIYRGGTDNMRLVTGGAVAIELTSAQRALFVDGAVGSPAVSFASETGTGVYRIGSGNIGIAVSGTNVLSATSSIVNLTRATQFGGSLTAADISADQNNYSPAGMDVVTFVRLRTNDTNVRNITGFTGGVDGRIIVFTNYGTSGVNGSIKFQYENASSSAENRIGGNGNNFNLNPRGGGTPANTAMFMYDGTSQRWLPIENS